MVWNSIPGVWSIWTIPGILKIEFNLVRTSTYIPSSLIHIYVVTEDIRTWSVIYWPRISNPWLAFLRAASSLNYWRGWRCGRPWLPCSQDNGHWSSTEVFQCNHLRPIVTEKISVAIQIRWQFTFALIKIVKTDRCKMLHMICQLYCRRICKDIITRKGNAETKFSRIWAANEQSLVACVRGLLC